MANVVTDLKSEILRIAKKEAKAEISKARQNAAEYRSEVARLKRLLQQKEREIKRLKKQKPVEQDDELAGIRFSAKSVKSQRSRLGLSLMKYAALLNVTSLTLRRWESGEARPRKSQILRLVAIRGISKREAIQQLSEIDARMKKSK